MKTQQLFIRQLQILLFFGTMVMVLLTLNHSDHADGQVAITEPGIQLIWNGNELIANNQGDMEYKPDGDIQIPSNIAPLFFQPIQINDADFELLLTIPGVGPKLASEIGVVKKHLGRFEKQEDLLLVNGIGRKKMNTLKEYFSFQ